MTKPLIHFKLKMRTPACAQASAKLHLTSNPRKVTCPVCLPRVEALKRPQGKRGKPEGWD